MLWIRLGALLMTAGILLGAFGAHGLQGTLNETQMRNFHTAVFYQLVNALGLLVVGTLSLQSPSRARLVPSGGFLTAGILLFSGSLYLSVTSPLTGLGAVTPLGGICLAAGWIFLIFSV
jgi:uncharacterized membrane protein YgdD (TMEM256/DUF423 family)